MIDERKLDELAKAQWVKGFSTEDLKALYRDGYYAGLKAFIKEVKELKTNIEKLGFEKDEVVLTLEDWIAE